jgi:hypothetical protein
LRVRQAVAFSPRHALAINELVAKILLRIIVDTGSPSQLRRSLEMNSWLERLKGTGAMACCLSMMCALLLPGCAAIFEEETEPMEATEPAAMEQRFAGDPAQPKHIMVFLDGTRNDASSGTNVRRLFDAVVAAKDTQTTSIYIEGVGSAETPLLGAGLGFGMEQRILRGYDFIAQAYRPGDNVFIFGFSRGAHSARALAGLVAYAGVPPASIANADVRRKGHNDIIELVKPKSDKTFEKHWKSWRPGNLPLLAKEIKDRLNVEVIPLQIAFLGVWDTVPGSYFKKFDECKEKPGWRPGDRYKSDSYPPIRTILHAVSLDEKRSKFHPLLLCPTLNRDFTSVHEVWFPGAHADVGGGYEDSQDLPNLSLQWMAGELGKRYAPLSGTQFGGNPLGLAHWSIGDSPANFRSDCRDRQAAPDAMLHPSIGARRSAGTAPLRIHGVIEQKPYPFACSGQ